MSNKIYIYSKQDKICEHYKQQGINIDSDNLNTKYGITYPDFYPKIGFTNKEKQNIKQQYIDSIASLGRHNNYALHWLAHPVSEKNDLLPDNLFNKIVTFLYFLKIIKTYKQDDIVINIPEYKNSVNIISYLNLKQINYVSDINNNSLFSNLANVILNDISFLTKKYNISKVARKLTSINSTISINSANIIFRTWIDERSVSKLPKNKDIFFGELPNAIAKKGKSVLFYGALLGENETLLKSLGNSSNLIFSESLIGIKEIINAFIFKYYSLFKFKFPDSIKINSYEVKNIYVNNFRDSFYNTNVINNFLIYLGALKLADMIDVKRFYIPFENYNWEKLTMLALRKKKPDVNIIGFQHAQIQPCSLKFFLGKNEAIKIPLPDRIITVGDITKKMLINNNYPKDLLVSGCGLRQNISASKNQLKRKNRKDILVLLWTFERSIELLNFVLESSIHNKYNVTVSPHPVNPISDLKQKLEFLPEKYFKISNNKDLKQTILNSDIVLYSGTTGCLDTLKLGKPVICIDFNDFLSVDPIFGFNDFKWTVSSPEKLEKKIKTIYKIKDNEFYKLQKKAINYANGYLKPVNKSNLKPFIDPI